MRTVELKVYKYDELSDKDKEKVRNKYRETALDYDWWDFVFEDAKAIGKILGIEVEDIAFDLYNQGSGACFEGNYAYSAGWRDKLKAYAPKDESLEKLGLALQVAQKEHAYKLEATIKKNWFQYSHENTVDIEVYNRDNSEVVSGTMIPDVLKDYMRWIRDRLYEEYDYRMSDECIEEDMRANDYEFIEDGLRMWND